MLKPYESYKETNIPWLETVPSHWRIVKINELFSERRSKVSDKEYPPLSVTKNGIVPQLETAAKSNDGDNRKLVVEGDFVINSRSDRKGSSGISNLTGSVSLINITLEPREENNSTHMHYLLKSNEFIEEYYRNGRGIVADLWTTRFNEMKIILLPIPPQSEQDQIVRYLDWQTTKIDKLVNVKKKQIELLKEQRQAIINKAVTKGLDDTVPMKDSGVEWLGEVPESWAVNRLKNGCLMINRGAAPQYTEDTNNAMVVNQATFSKGYWDISKVRYTLTNPVENRGLLYTDDVLIASTGGGVLGKVYHYKEDGVFIADSHVSIIRCNEKLVSKFVYYSFLVKYDLINAVLAQGSTNQTELQGDWLASFYFPFASIKEQQSIVTYLDEKTALIDKAITVIEKEIELVSEYKISLVSSVVTGKVDVCDVVVPEFIMIEEV